MNLCSSFRGFTYIGRGLLTVIYCYTRNIYIQSQQGIDECSAEFIGSIYADILDF